MWKYWLLQNNGTSLQDDCRKTSLQQQEHPLYYGSLEYPNLAWKQTSKFQHYTYNYDQQTSQPTNSFKNSKSADQFASKLWWPGRITSLPLDYDSQHQHNQVGGE